METRALIGHGPPRRVLHAAGLLAAALAALLVAWFVSGWGDVRGRQRLLRDAPRVLADARAGELGRELRAALAALYAREADRPYFHYQNLFHDPRASAGWSVAPSPLAAGPSDPFVLGYFQLDARGRVTTPTINDDVPDLSEPRHLAGNLAFRDAVTRDLARAIGGVARPRADAAVDVVAEAAPPATPSRHPPRAPISVPSAPRPQVVELDAETYTQNASSNQVYQQQRDNNNVVPERALPSNPVGVKPASRPPAPVTITVSPLEWRTLAFAGAPALVAVRQVDTPDGALAQGFVLDRATLTSWLAGRAGDQVAELRDGADASGLEIAPGWHLQVTPNPRALARAASDAAQIAVGFAIRFVAVGVLALLLAALVVVLVARAEQLARERSQFAAAAAHELRTPLAGLQLYGDMLGDGLGDPGKARVYARRMSEEAARLGRVVSNVLGFSQLERGNLNVDTRVASLGEVLDELADHARPALERAGAALVVRVDREQRARFDRDALTRIVGNLLDNAEKYARGAVDRTIELAAHDRGDVVEITVGDRGPGVADPTRLFRPFARGVDPDGPPGLGLGLALSRSLARAMGGDLVYRAADPAGAEFAVQLPRA